MKVVCIQDGPGLEGYPVIKRGNVYHVVEEKTYVGRKFLHGDRLYSCVDGVYYKLMETGSPFYHSSLFIEINDPEIDELELVNEKEEAA